MTTVETFREALLDATAAEIDWDAVAALIHAFTVRPDLKVQFDEVCRDDRAWFEQATAQASR
jgi:hypothetical protein